MSAIWWIRRDLRIDDSAALATALRLLVDFLAQRFGGDEAVWDRP